LHIPVLVISLLFLGAGPGLVFADFSPKGPDVTAEPAEAGPSRSDPSGDRAIRRVQADPHQSAPARDAVRPIIDCTCRYRGQDYMVGESVCIRGNLAVCETFLNNTSWSISKTPCPVARVRPATPPS